MTNVTELNDHNFEINVHNTTKPVLVTFFAPWCGHCNMQAPILEEFARETGNDALVAKVNVDNNKALAEEYEISGIPALIVFKNGKQVEQKTGVQQKKDLQKIVEKYK